MWMIGRWGSAAAFLAVVVGINVARTPVHGQSITRGDTLAAARRIMTSARFASLATLDEAGRPQARMVDPFEPDSSMVVWIGTNPRTRKVEHIQRDSRIALTYYDPGSFAYVTLVGRADLVSDSVQKRLRFKQEWANLFPDVGRDYLLIRVTPEWLELVSQAENMNPDSLTWRTPTVRFSP